MGIAWCRERLEQAENSKNPVDRILIRCSNVIKPKTQSRSQDRRADEVAYRGVGTKDLGVAPPPNVAPPRSRGRVRCMSDWQTCGLIVPDAADVASVAPVPPPRKKRKQKTNGGVAASVKSLETSLGKLADGKNNADADAGVVVEKPGGEQRRQHRFVKLYEVRAGKSSGAREGKPNSKVVKNVSTVSLPNYNDLVKPTGKENGKTDAGTEPQSGDAKPLRRTQSATSLSGEGSTSILSSLSEATIHRLDAYMKRCRSFGCLKPQQLLEKLEEFNKCHRSASESSDSWSGLDDWDLGIIEYFDPETANAPPLTPKSTLPPRSRIFSVGAPNLTSSPASETADEGDAKGKESTSNERKSSEVREGDEDDSARNQDRVPRDWFNGSDRQATQEVQKRAVTPPPSPEGGLVAEVIESEAPRSSLAEMLTKYRDDEASDVGSVRGESRESPEEEKDDVEAELREGSSRGESKSWRARSSSLMEINPKLLHDERFGRRAPSVGVESTTHLLGELTRNGGAIEKELMTNPEQLLNGLRRASLYENLPEDPFDIYLQRKKTSLRESLTSFLGFNQNQGTKEEEKPEREEEKLPPPLPLNPPPAVTTSLPQASDSVASCPLVTITSDNDKN